MIAATKPNSRISTCDLITSYLQSDHFPEVEAVIIRYLNPETNSLQWEAVNGVIYGMVRAGNQWARTFRTWMAGLGFHEIANAESVYYMDNITVTT